MSPITYKIDVPLARNPIIVVCVLGALATVTTALRFLALRIRRVSPGLSEYLILGALFIVYADIAIALVLVIIGGTILPLEALYGIVLGLVKTSILLFYSRIFGTKKSFRISLIITMCIIWAWAISVILETLLLCRPLKYNWDTSIKGTCGNRNAGYVIAGTMNLITDLMVMGLPIPHIWKLQLNTAKKAALSSVFCIGLLVSIISLIRLKSLMVINFSNITESVQMGVMWTIVEPELAIICANMPLLKTILSTFAPSLFSSGRRNKYGKYGASDQQTFSRLQDGLSSMNGGKNTVYPMNRLDHEALHTHISTGSPDSQRILGKSGEVFTSSGSLDDNSLDGPHEIEVQPASGINVTQNFSIEYR
ncbi:hypothetical protein N7495_009884 [Penicillium taxi]|uniref:uncharacterized protein n=1 Tax=Penicillium taxi TaxID=168475 RepID=UPI002544E07E|nr:uncharacterized protein N7495_009884 [Penicillium taxi]KAJ5885374.1 hypothetical protein N7495_009884 [Penicillium taxi]